MCVCACAFAVKPSFYLDRLQRLNAASLREQGSHQKLNESASSHTISRQITIDKTNEEDYGILLLHLI